MKYISLGSGSRGNATLVMEKNRGVLIDCGFNRKTILQRLQDSDTDPRQLDAIFVTHEHGDHANGVKALSEALSIPFYSSFGTARKMDWVEHELWRCVEADQSTSVGHLNVQPVVVPHDAEEPFQYIVENSANKRLGILSDLGAITPHIIEHYSYCHALQLEANYDPEMLQSGPYPPSLRARVASDFGHLSNNQCAQLIASVQWHGLMSVTAGHISEKNNSVDLVCTELSQVLDCPPSQVKILAQNQISSWLELA